MVLTGDLGYPLNFERLVSFLPNVIYEPEQFLGAIYYARELDGASFLIFASGKVVLAGLKKEEQLNKGRRVVAQLAQLHLR